MGKQIVFDVIVPAKPVIDVRTSPQYAAEVMLPGTPGPAGDSAYQLAVKAGFEGSLEEWFASLKGAPGKTGASGVYFGSTAPTDASINVWIDPEGMPDITDGDAEAY